MLEILTYIALIAFIHTIGEILYKIGSESYFAVESMTEKNPLIFYFMFFLQGKVILSLFFSLLSRLLFALILQFGNLNITPTIYLAAIIIFGQLAGLVAFKEKIHSFQVIGIIFILSGIFFIGGM